MLLRRFTDYILRSRVQAMGTAFVCAFIPLLGTVSILIAAFVTLRKGIQEGFFVLVAATLPLFIEYLGYPPDSGGPISVFDVTLIMVASNILTWLFAVVLRKFPSWGLVLQLGALLGILFVCIIHIVYPDILVWWQTKLSGYFADTMQAMSQAKSDDADLQKTTVTKLVETLSPYATGWAAVFLIFNSQLQLFLARWWQAAVFNPGGLRKELCSIRMSKIAGVVFVIVQLLSIWAYDVALDVIPILYITFGLAGLSLLHFGLATVKSGWFWLALIYIAMVLVPISVVLISMIALLDVWFDFRKRLKKQS